MLTRRRLIIETAEDEATRDGSFVHWGVLLALWGLVFWPIFPELWDVWMSDSDNSHGVLVPAIAAFLIWLRRKEVLWAEARPSLWGLGLLAGSLLIYLVSLRAHIALSARIAMVGSLAGLVWWHLGERVFRQLLFPLAFLGFMVPVPDSISGMIAFPLQLFATSASAQVIRAIGIPVLEEGTMLYFATTSLEVSGACSGIRSMLAYLMLGVLFTHLAGNTMGRAGKGILLLSTIPLALFVNIMRISATGVLASLLGGRVARGFLHEFSGLAIFAVGFALFWVESLVLKRWMPDGPRGVPLTTVTEEELVMPRHQPFLVSVALLVIAGAVAYPIAWASDVGVVKVNLDQLPRRILGFDGRDDRFEESVYSVLNADHHLLRQYRGGGDRNVWLYIGYYGTAKGGRPSHVPESCYTGQGFSIVEWTTIPAPGNVSGMLNKMHIKRGDAHQLVLFWYQSKDKVLADGIEQNLRRIENRIFYNRDDGALVRLSTTMNMNDEAEAESLLQGFAVELLSLIPSHWPEEE